MHEKDACDAQGGSTRRSRTAEEQQVAIRCDVGEMKNERELLLQYIAVVGTSSTVGFGEELVEWLDGGGAASTTGTQHLG